MGVTTLVAVSMLALVACLPASAGSARMSLDVGAGLVAEADYWPGQADMPAVLVLHGFLQTREFPTVRRLAEGLADAGYSVLLPTLSLGLDRRKQSLACEAIHLHTMQQDIAELAAWTDWLRERSGKSPVLVGHSAGGVQLAALLDEHPRLPVRHAILISLSYFGEEQGPAALATLRAGAQRDLASDADAIHPYALTFCREYVTSSSALLSYLHWDRETLRAALVGNATPVTVIYGDKDQRIDTEWLELLRAGGVEIRAVRGANHFFDLAHEFDLLDEVIRLVGGVQHG